MTDMGDIVVWCKTHIIYSIVEFILSRVSNIMKRVGNSKETNTRVVNTIKQAKRQTRYIAAFSNPLTIKTLLGIPLGWPTRPTIFSSNWLTRLRT